VKLHTSALFIYGGKTRTVGTSVFEFLVPLFSYQRKPAANRIITGEKILSGPESLTPRWFKVPASDHEIGNRRQNPTREGKNFFVAAVEVANQLKQLRASSGNFSTGK
jgi:hypothetical protein